jgi:hypothetical protein
MPKFKVGDIVEKSNTILPDARRGIVTRVIPSNQGCDLFNEYQVDFGDGPTGVFYETQLRFVAGTIFAHIKFPALPLNKCNKNVVVYGTG